ncbi:hypothetical protein ACOMHN_018391 [Nucella lapillus]
MQRRTSLPLVVIPLSPFHDPLDPQVGGIAIIYRDSLSKHLTIKQKFYFNHSSFQVIQSSLTLQHGALHLFCLYRPPPSRKNPIFFTPASCQLVLPSTRVVYYLHTRSATWNEASSTCNSYGAVLVTMADFNATQNRLRYVDNNVWGQELSGMNQGFWAGLYRNSTNNIRWQKCADYDNTAALPQVTSGTSGVTSFCYVSTPALTLSVLRCDDKKPYICQRDDGQCWFQPYINKQIQDGDSDSSTFNQATTDEAECAKLCRTSMDGTRQCWAFSFGGSTATATATAANPCRLHVSEIDHKYALSLSSQYFKDSSQHTAYVKVCTGGWITSLDPTITDNSPTAKDENCTVHPTDAWDSSVCYCECDQPPIILKAETLVMTIEEKVDKIVKELQVNPQNTSSTRRKKISAEDDRPSAQGIGFFGIGFLIVIFGGIFLMDANVLYIHAIRLCKGVKGNNQSDA